MKKREILLDRMMRKRGKIPWKERKTKRRNNRQLVRERWILGKVKKEKKKKKERERARYDTREMENEKVSR